MSFKRILIEEKEKQDILKLYGVLNEQGGGTNITSEGTYVVKNDHVFSISGQQLGGSPLKIYVRKDTIIYPDKDGKSLIFNVYYKENNQFKLSGSKGKLNCGQGIINVGNQSYTQVGTQPFKTTINNLFCSGDILKTKKTETKTETTPTTPKTIKLPNLTDKNYCNLPGDKVWSYVKLDDGTWYASKNKVDWYKLELPKYQKAIDLLAKDSSCAVIDVLPKLSLKPAQGLDVGVDKNLEVIPSKQEMINKGLETAKFISNLQNRPQ